MARKGKSSGLSRSQSAKKKPAAGKKKGQFRDLAARKDVKGGLLSTSLGLSRARYITAT